MTTILVVDDDLSVRQMLNVLLRSYKYTVVLVDNGQAALDSLPILAPDLIVMDLNMPVVDGWQATKLIRSNPQFATVPIIALTAHSLPSVLEQAKAAGINDVLTKPSDITAILGTINYHLAISGEALLSGSAHAPTAPANPKG